MWKALTKDVILPIGALDNKRVVLNSKYKCCCLIWTFEELILLDCYKPAQTLPLYFHITFNQLNPGDKNMYGNFMVVVFSVKPQLIRNRLSVNNINNKLITGLQITFTADNY